MCGVIGYICERHRDDLGSVASELLRQLEYRGYDSTGAAVQGLTDAIHLAKGVGAPSAVVGPLGITGMKGNVICGQVRWATFGAVDEKNAQPHVMCCKTLFYGAHNGNVTNCDDLKAWLTREGHQVLSDNDGEMLVHTVEHFFARGLDALDAASRQDPEKRALCMRAAIAEASRKLRGSYAAIVVDPVTRRSFAIKAGSSLYFGVGRDEIGGNFAIASSDLSAVLRFTRVLLPLSEGEFVEYGPDLQRVFKLMGDQPPLEQVRKPVRSRLRAQDTGLIPPYRTFMEQEIAAQEQTCRDVVTAFHGGSAATRQLAHLLNDLAPSDIEALHAILDDLRGATTDDRIRDTFATVRAKPALRNLVELGRQSGMGNGEHPGVEFHSSEASFFQDLAHLIESPEARIAARLLDAFVEHGEVGEFRHGALAFARACDEAIERGNRIYAVCCGSSNHAARAAALFFDEIAGAALIPLLPGEFRGAYMNSLRDGDVFVAVSQSGETKDLIDVLNDIAASGKRIERIALVNNVNSTLAQEKADLVIPLRCGVEVAVPATKSFMNQMAVFFGLALELGKARQRRGHLEKRLADRLAQRELQFAGLPELIRRALTETRESVSEVAAKLALAPSMHLLATRILSIAKEGALKIREVVLNHTEGYEASEFKHGPNTILGLNTVFGPEAVHALLDSLANTVSCAFDRVANREVSITDLKNLTRAILTSPFAAGDPFANFPTRERAIIDEALDRNALLGTLKRDYPLVYITGPDERDVALTVSQINTHKIRGSKTIIIAEENAQLRQAAEKAPTNNPGYDSAYIALPKTGDTLMTSFSAIVVLQRLALEMSEGKAQYLDSIGLADHGVHPDVPKNVSKSITVD